MIEKVADIILDILSDFATANLRPVGRRRRPYPVFWRSQKTEWGAGGKSEGALADMIQAYLEDLESRIDDAVEEALFAAWADFSEGRFPGDVFTPSRPAPSPPGIEWPELRINEALDDLDKMALKQLRVASVALAKANGEVLNVRSNYGTGIMPSLFGAELFVMPDETDTLPTTRPMGGADAMRALLDRGAPDLRAGLGERVFAMAERFKELFAPYPKIARHVHVYHPDTQGPMDICELLWGSALFVDLIDVPELAAQVLELVTETYIRFMREWDRVAPLPERHSPHWGLVHKGRIMLREDSAMNLSPEMFETFIRPYDVRLLDTFGGGAVHFCGRGDHFIECLADIPGVNAVNLSQPEYNDMETVFRHTVDKGVAMLALDIDVARQALADGRDLHGLVHCGNWMD